jgi:hypothetical protein
MIHIDHKYIRLLSSQLANFKQKSGDLYNFRCPVCGDSEKNKYKSRGYVFRKRESLIYKCHNCGDGRSLGNLIKHLDSTLHGQYVIERYKSDSLYKESTAPTIEFQFDAPVFAKHSPGKLLPGVGAFRLSTLPDDHVANQFVKNRKLPHASTRGLYYIDDEEKLELLSPKYKDRIVGHSKRLLLPFCDTDGNMTGLTGRSLDDTGMRYLALKFNAENEPLVFGLEKWNARKPTIVVEGAFDSLFLRNAIAVGGSDFSRLGGLVEKETTTIVFDNEPRNKEIVNQMSRIIKSGWTICIWPENILENDINDLVIAGRTSDEIQDIINKNKFAGLQAKFKLNGWKKC